MESLGTYLREVRKEKRKLSLREVSKKVGISHSYLSQIENGYRKQPKPYILRALAQELAIDYKTLMQKAGYVKESFIRQDYMAGKQGISYPSASERQKEMLDLKEILLDENKQFSFHQVSLSQTELQFIYQLTQILTTENKTVDEVKLEKILAIAKIILA